MCGIAGVVSFGQPVEERRLTTMCRAIFHRGPDHSGTYFDTVGDLSVGLGSQRLSIIDLSDAGNQPMSNEDGTVWIAYNGELYNHQELRQALVAAGHQYRSSSDTETIVHAYEEYGLGCVERFNGMFGFALYDRARQRVVLVRDQMGIKPIYYSWDGHTLLFCSELQALYASSDLSRELDPAAVELYFSLGFVPSPYSMFKSVKKLPPGSMLIVENGQLRIESFWAPCYAPMSDEALANNHLVPTTRSLLENAVHRQMMSDVPLGVFLSGGLDSTLITVLAQRFHDRPLDTFSMGFADANGKVAEDSPFNADLGYARQVSAELGTHHHEVVVTADGRIADMMRQTMKYLDEPLWETSFTSLHLMSGLAREHGVIVVLTGDGSDEIFGGYPWHEGSQRLETYERIPLLRYGLPLLSLVGGSGTLGIKARDLQRKLGQTDVVKYQLFHSVFSADERQSLIHADLADGLEAGVFDHLVENVMQRGSAGSFSDKLALADLTLWVREHFNQRVDRMSMMHSVEARVPFQDVDIVNFALTIPVSHHVTGGRGKYLLRQAFADVLPASVLNRPKRPFSTPTQGWLRGPLAPLVQDMLSPDRVKAGGVLNNSAVQSTLNQFTAGDDTFAYRIWALLNFQLWQESLAS